MHFMTCRDAKRGEQASTSRVKATGGMPGPGRIPSAVPCGPWSERLQLGGGHAEHRRPSAALHQTFRLTLLWNHVDDWHRTKAVVALGHMPGVRLRAYLVSRRASDGRPRVRQCADGADASF